MINAISTKLKTIATVAVFIILFILSSVYGGGAYAHAAVQGVAEKYEAQNVWTDINGMTVDGKGLDLSLYNFDEHKNVQLVSFVEFCYSPFKDKQSDFGLYVYVYNPRGLDWTSKPGMNKIQLRYTGKTTSSFDKYDLKFINRSNKAGYEGLFYKFKVAFTAAQRSAVLDTLNSSERVYEISGIELYDSVTNATEYKIANVYKYKGFAQGYGATGSENDTLTCESSGMDITLTLDVHPTFYRPSGNDGNGVHTQNTLYSVYFAVPNDVLKEYGGLSAVHATWLNVKTGPVFVTGNKTVYNALLPYIGKTIPTYKEFRKTNPYGFVSDLAVYNSYQSGTSELLQLNYIFLAENGDALNYVVSGEKLLQYMKDFTTDNLGADDIVVGGGSGGGGSHGVSARNGLVLDKYSPDLFESVDEKFTEVNIKANDNYTLVSERIDKHWWQKLFGGSYVATHDEFNISEAIHPVTEDDFKGTKNEICDRLLIDKCDYDEFKEYYDNAKDSTVFLLRYQVSDYVSAQCTEYKYCGTWLQPEITELLDTNAYIAQETINLDFDIIDVTCRKGDVETVIACIMSPIDIAPDITPPPVGVMSDFWIYALVITLAIIVLNVVMGILSRRIGNDTMLILGSFSILLVTVLLRICAEVYKSKFIWLNSFIPALNITCWVFVGIFALIVIMEIILAILNRRGNR